MRELTGGSRKARLLLSWPPAVLLGGLVVVLCFAVLVAVGASPSTATAYGYDAPYTSMTPPTNIVLGVAEARASFDRPGETIAAVRFSVATEDEGSTLLHYTTADRAEQILGDGQINPSADGNTYLTPDRYADGATAQSRLAMGTEPEGYIEVPRPPGAPEPTVVDPFNGQPGGGLEVPVPGPVSLPPGSIFRPF